ncbi:MAG: DUF4199 domain-containing protein [Bacteroidetes bacterium]|nr:DUF4199 domain-containing protein [Bacteroidota bacterium]
MIQDSEIKNLTPMKSALKWGLILGLSEVVTHLFFYLLGKPITGITTLTYILLLLAFFIFVIQNFRDKELGGFISWSEGFRIALLTGLFGALIYMAYYTILVTFDKQTFIDASIEQLTQGVEKMKQYISDEEALSKIDDGIAEGIENLKMMTPLKFGMNQFAKSLFAIIPLALLVPVFMKKKDPNLFN